MLTYQMCEQRRTDVDYPTSCAKLSQAECLLSDEIHVWWAHLDPTPAKSREFQQWLSGDEAARHARFRFERDRDRYLARRGLLRMLLGRYLHIPPADVRFLYGEHGKPMLAQSDLSFNMSESGGCAIYAVTRDRRIGVDIEQIRNTPGLEHIARRFFSEAEHALLRDCPNNEEKKQTFFRCWARKEALIKALGQGLHIPLETFDASGHAARIASGDSDSGEWTVHDVQTGPGFAAALAIEGNGNLRVRVQSLADDGKGSTDKEQQP